MSNRICKTCGEEFSDTYKKCPFCEEEEAIRRGRPIHRQNGGKRLDKQRHRSSGGVGGIFLLLTSVIIIGVLVFVFAGDRIADSFGIRTDPEQLGSLTANIGADKDEDKDKDEAEDQTPSDPTAGDDVPSVPESPLVLSQSAIALNAGESALLTVSGNEGDVTWTSSDESIATVRDGTITAHAGGNATITVLWGEYTASCALQVNGNPPAGDAAGSGADGGSTDASTGTAAKLTLNTTDFTIRSGETAQMRVKGTESKVTWASKDTSIAAINENGLVWWVGAGTTTIIATVDGQTLECVARCK